MSRPCLATEVVTHTRSSPRQHKSPGAAVATDPCLIMFADALLGLELIKYERFGGHARLMFLTSIYEKQLGFCKPVVTYVSPSAETALSSC